MTVKFFFLKINYFLEFWRINLTTASLLNGDGLPFWEVIFIQVLETQFLQNVRIITKTNEFFVNESIYFFFLENGLDTHHVLWR